MTRLRTSPLPAAGLFAFALAVLLAHSAAAMWPFGDKKTEDDGGEKTKPVLTAQEKRKLPNEESKVNVANLEKQAKDGFPNAQVALGYLYLTGENKKVAQDYKKAVYWFQKAADRGNGIALFNLAICHDEGFGVKKDTEKAHALYVKAAETGILEAQLNAAVNFETKAKALGAQAAKNGNAVGAPVAADNPEAQKLYADAFRFYKMAADQNPNSPNLGAVRKTAIFLMEGIGCKADPAAAAAYFRIGAENGDSRAQVRLADCYQKGAGVERDSREMLHWLMAAAAADDSEAQAKIGYCYAEGVGTSRDSRTAFHWFSKAAQNGYTPAQVMLGNLYMGGSGVEADPAKGVEWHRKAAVLGDAAGQFSLGADYQLGRGVRKDSAEAFKWFKLAADQGYAPAQYNLGAFYEDGIAVAADPAKAAGLYRAAAEKGDPQGMAAYGQALLTGKGVAKNRDEARKHLVQAALLGEKDARALVEAEFPDVQLPAADEATH
jgi:TPR repeat protein